MPATVRELVNRTGTGVGSEAKARSRRYLIQNAADESEALSALENEAPPTVDGIPRDPPKVDEVEELDGVWFGTVDYSVASTSGGQDSQLPPEGTKEFSFEIQAKQQKITNSLETLRRYSFLGLDTVGDVTPDFGGLINVGLSGGSGKATVGGVEIVLPEFIFSETHIQTGITESYITAVMKTVGKTNQATFRGGNEGEVLLIGVRGQRKGLVKWEIQFSFAFSETVADLQVADIGPITKGGWEYLWVFTEDEEQTITQSGQSHKITVSVPAYVYIEKVYKSADYTALNLGASPLELPV